MTDPINLTVSLAFIFLLKTERFLQWFG